MRPAWKGKGRGRHELNALPGAAPPLPEETVTAQCLRLSQQYISDAEAESNAYKRSVVNALSLKPDARASLQ